MEISEKDRLLFMKYALPCAVTLVSRGSVEKDDIENLIDAVKKGRQIPEGAEKIFKVAMSACSLIALDSHKEFIDIDVIHNYFLYGHDDVIDRRFDEMRDFDPEACRVRPGIVKHIFKDSAVVLNSAGEKRYRTDFVPDLKIGDRVATHRDFVVEKISADAEKRMKK